MCFLVGNQVIEAGPGDAVFAPRGIPHTFRIKSAVARAITVCTPGGFEEWFRQLGEPASSFELPEEVVPLSAADFPKMLALAKRLETEIIVHEVDI